MAHAYETFARGGRFTYGTMSPGAVERSELGCRVPGPGRHPRRSAGPTTASSSRSRCPNGDKAENEPRERPRAEAGRRRPGHLDPADGRHDRHRRRAPQIPGTFVAGKTGTTENYGDAWFVGWTQEITVAVWVGYPDELKPMETEFNGEPVAGGTYPGRDLEDVHGAARCDAQGVRAEEDRRSRRRRRSRPRRRRPTTPGTAGARRRRRRAPEDAAPTRRGRRHRARAGGTGARAAAPRAAPAAPAPAEQPPSQPASRASSGARRGATDAAGDRQAARAAARPATAARRCASPAAQKRHSSSAAFVIPIRVPATTSTSSQPGGRGPIRIGPPTRSVPLSSSSIAERLGELARARAELLDARAAPRRSRIASSAGDRLERADQHRRADALAARRPR